VAKKKAMREELATATIPRYAGLLEARLEKMKQTPFFQSDRIYVHEVAIYVWVKTLRSGTLDHIPTTVLSSYKVLNELHDKVANHPKVQEWNRLEHTAPKLKFTYFPSQGRGEPIRLAFHIGDIEFEDERVSNEGMLARKPSLPFNQFPVLEVNGEEISQALAILRYAGTMSGLYPMTDPIAAYRVDELLSILDEMFYNPLWGESHREKDMEKKEPLRAKLSTVVPKTLGFLEKRIGNNKGPYAAGSNLTIVDLAIYSVVVDFSINLPKIMSTMKDSYPNVYRVYDQVLKHPKVVEWNAAHNQ
jgi:glutathione S-transferase